MPGTLWTLHGVTNMLLLASYIEGIRHESGKVPWSWGTVVLTARPEHGGVFNLRAGEWKRGRDMWERYSGVELRTEWMWR